MTARRAVAAIAVIAAAAAAMWWYTSRSDEAEIRRRLDRLATEINAGVTEGLGTTVRAATIGTYFTDDVTIDLGPGTAPLHGRETLVGMAARLQPRTSVFRLNFVDITPKVAQDRASATVSLTAEIINTSVSTGEQALDAREFAFEMTRASGVWRISRVTSVETIK
jgi:hypothetical protein